MKDDQQGHSPHLLQILWLITPTKEKVNKLGSRSSFLFKYTFWGSVTYYLTPSYTILMSLAWKWFKIPLHLYSTQTGNHVNSVVNVIMWLHLENQEHTLSCDPESQFPFVGHFVVLDKGTVFFLIVLSLHIGNEDSKLMHGYLLRGTSVYSCKNSGVNEPGMCNWHLDTY